MAFPPSVLGDPAPAGVQEVAAGLTATATVYGNRKATGSVTYGGNLSATNTITINGVTFTAVASGATGAQFNVGGSLSATLDNIVTVVNASTNPLIADLITVAKNGGSTGITVTADAYGVAGNDYTLAASGGSPTVSGATLTGGLDSAEIPDNRGTIFLVTAAGGTMDFTMPAGAEGQEVTLYFLTKGSGANAVVTGTWSGGTTATFDTAGDFIHVKWLGAAWRALVNSSVTIA
jgi:hypothetical protein